MFFHIGYSENFEGLDAVILISGDGDALQALAERLRVLENPKAEPLEIHRLPFVEVHGGVELTAYGVGKELGVRRRNAKSTRPNFAWRHSEEGWLEAAAMIDQVAHSGGHQTLQCIGVEDATVFVSGEYGESWWRRFDEEARAAAIKAEATLQHARLRSPLILTASVSCLEASLRLSMIIGLSVLAGVLVASANYILHGVAGFATFTVPVVVAWFLFRATAPQSDGPIDRPGGRVAEDEDEANRHR